MHHATTLKGYGVDTAGDDEIVADRNAVTPLFGGPLTDPLAPCAVRPEAQSDFAVVGRQVVLGEEVYDHRRFGNLVQLGILWGPVLTTEEREVASAAPGNVVVRIPGLRLREVAVQILLHHGFQLRE